MKSSLLICIPVLLWPALAGAADPSTISPLPTAAEKKARLNQPWLNQIKLPYANQLGSFNGKGVLVGMADTGVDTGNAELKGQVSKAYNVYTGTGNISDTVGHGTHVAGILAGTTDFGAPLQGVAGGARLAVAKVFSGSDAASSDRIDQGINWLVNIAKAPIVSLSLGGASASNMAAIKNGVSKGVLFTIAAGNDGRASVSWPAHYASQLWANNQIIVVGAVDASNKLASFSNYGADTARWFVVAPGVGIASSYIDGRYVSMSGTSMATPMVAGQAALIKSEWTFLTASQISQIIFKTATRLGKATDSAPDPVYGWGLINIGKSMSPIGNIVAVAGNATVPLSSAGMVSAIGVSGVGKLTVTGVDDYNRGFGVDLSRSVQSRTSQGASAATMFAVLERQSGLIERVHDGSVLRYAPDGSAMALSTRMASGTVFGFGAGNMSASFFGLEATGLAPLALAEGGKFNAPYFAMVKDGAHAGVSFAVSGNTRLRFGALSETAGRPQLPGTAFDEHKQRMLTSGEFEQKMGRAVGIVSVGLLRENGSLLGSQQGQALALNASPLTTFTAVSAGYALSPDSSLVAMASSGRTAGFGNSDSLIAQVSRVSTFAYSVGFATRQIFDRSDRLGLTISVPARVRDGSIRLYAPVAQTDTGALNYASQTLNLRPTAIERDYELSYATSFGRNGRGGKLTGLMMLRVNPGHDVTAASDWLLGVRYTRGF